MEFKAGHYYRMKKRDWHTDEDKGFLCLKPRTALSGLILLLELRDGSIVRAGLPSFDVYEEICLK